MFDDQIEGFRAARHLRVEHGTLRRWVRRGHLAGYSNGGDPYTLRVSLASLNALCRELGLPEMEAEPKGVPQ